MGLMPDMLAVSAFQVGYPVARIILVEANDVLVEANDVLVEANDVLVEANDAALHFVERFCSVPTSLQTLSTPNSGNNFSNSRAIFTGAAGSQNVAVPTSTSEAPAIINSAASSPPAIPPIPITGIFTAFAACSTIRSAIGLIAGPDNPPYPAPMRG
jgi:hypothetical protein